MYTQLNSYRRLLVVLHNNFLFFQIKFFQTCGPDPVTFLIAGELFPTRFRSTGYAITAAIGKLAAVISYLGFELLFDVEEMDKNPKRVFYWSLILAFAMLFGMGFTYYLPETNGRSLEEIAGENTENEIGLNNNTR